MQMYYAASTRGFYAESVHGDRIPADAVAITADEHAALLDAQARGRHIQPDSAGRPVAVEYPPPSLDAAIAAKRAEIAAGFGAAMAASLTMPSAAALPSAYEVAAALYAWRVDDPDGYADLVAVHEARRTELLAALDAAADVDAVQAIAVRYEV